MAAVIGDLIPEPSRFHAMIANPSLQHHHHHHPHHTRDVSPRHRAASRPRQLSSASSSTTTPRPNHSPSVSAASATPRKQQDLINPESGRQTYDEAALVSAAAPASRIPSPPPSSSPAAARNVPDTENDANVQSMAPEIMTTTVAPSQTSSQSIHQPSPTSANFSITPQPAATAPSVPQTAAVPQQRVIHVRDLDHVRSLAQSDELANPSLSDASSQQTKYDISAMPTGDIIEMVSALLAKITTTNDHQHDAMQRNVTHQQQANQSGDSPGGSISPMSHSVLAFHGKNVPAITILSYLSRIHKYCPTTFEVFLSLLVFFDRMTERVNDMVAKAEAAKKTAPAASSTGAPSTPSDVPMRNTDADNSDESDSDLADDDDEMQESSRPTSGRIITVPTEGSGPSTYFVVDSFNIHRLIIAGVTAASKFFSDVFYTNSRYAKVGGLPLAELNHLELQFLVLNDFRLAIPVEDLEAYATMLVEFYAREVVSQG